MSGITAVASHRVGVIASAVLAAVTLGVPSMAAAQAQSTASLAEAGEWRYTVASGENLWSITQAHLQSLRYVEPLRQLNKIADPQRIPPGTELRIPIAWTRWQPLPIRIDAARGAAMLVRAGGEVPAKPGTVLTDGDSLRTGPESSAMLAIEGRGQVLVSPGSELSVERARLYGRSGVADLRLRLNRGNAEPQVRNLLRGSRFEIVTPAAVTAVRGTDFRVGTLGDGRRARTELTQGRLAVSDAAPGAGTRGVELAPGQGAVAGAGPLKPTPLLPALDLSRTPELIDRLPAELPLPAAAGVVAWRAQVLGRGSTMPAFDGVVTQPRVRFPDLPDGRYTLRARGIDAQGLEGADAQRDFDIDARPEPPFLSEPAADAQLAEGKPVFRWTQSAMAGTRYRFQLAPLQLASVMAPDAGSALAAPSVDVTLADAQWTPETALPPGRYRWRVRAIDPGEGPGPFSDLQSLRVLVPGPTLSAPAVSDDALVLRWRAAEGEARYELQLARDAGFSDIVASVVLPRAEATLARPPAGVYYLRARTVEADGAAGPYGAAQRIDVPERSNPWLMLIPLTVFLLLL